MPTAEQDFLIAHKLHDLCIGVASSSNGVVVDPGNVYVSDAMKAWVNINAISSTILLAAQYMNQNKASFNSCLEMENFIDWLQKKERESNG